MIREKFFKKNKFGFSLFEVVVTMSIVSIFIAACTNVFTQRYKKKIALPAHGRFECYYDAAGNLTERMVSENVIVSETHPAVDYCYFEPSKAAAYFVINTVGAGGAGGDTYGGSAGEYLSLFLTSTTHRLKLYPGLAANYDAATNTYDERGADTVVIDTDSNDREVMRMKGGRSSSGSVKELKSCSVGYKAFTCRLDPYCIDEPQNRKVRIGYCTGNGDSTSNERSEFITYDTLLRDYSGMTEEQLTQTMLTYTTTYYTLNITIDGNFTPDPQPSDFGVYLESLDIDDGIAAVDPIPGTGGAIQSNGGNGAVIIAW